MQVVLTLCCLVPCSNFKNSDNCLTHFAQPSQEKEQQNSSSYVHLFLFFPPKVHLQELKVIMKRRNCARLHSFLIATVSGLKKDYPVFSPKQEFQSGDVLQHALSIVSGKPFKLPNFTPSSSKKHRGDALEILSHFFLFLSSILFSCSQVCRGSTQTQQLETNHKFYIFTIPYSEYLTLPTQNALEEQGNTGTKTSQHLHSLLV